MASSRLRTWLLRSGTARSAGVSARTVLAAALAAPLIAACGAGEPTRRLEPSDAVRIETGLTYYSDARSTLRLDACLPPGTGTGRPSVLVVHGGAFVDGDRDDGGVRGLCTAVAKMGVVAFSVDYRLAPTYRYPAQVVDLTRAVTWVRSPAQVRRYALDPARVGVVGSSAGATLAQSLGTRGTGPRTRGARVAAVVSLSGVSVMTPKGLRLGQPSKQAVDLIGNYLGCPSVTADCPQAKPASPVTGVDRTDPPMLLVNGSEELVPREQAAAMTEALTEAKVPVQEIIVPGDRHGVALLTGDVRRALHAFLKRYL